MAGGRRSQSLHDDQTAAAIPRLATASSVISWLSTCTWLLLVLMHILLTRMGVSEDAALHIEAYTAIPVLAGPPLLAVTLGSLALQRAKRHALVLSRRTRVRATGGVALGWFVLIAYALYVIVILIYRGAPL